MSHRQTSVARAPPLRPKTYTQSQMLGQAPAASPPLCHFQHVGMSDICSVYWPSLSDSSPHWTLGKAPPSGHTGRWRQQLRPRSTRSVQQCVFPEKQGLVGLLGLLFPENRRPLAFVEVCGRQHPFFDFLGFFGLAVSASLIAFGHPIFSLVNQFARSAIGQQDSATHFDRLSEIRLQGRAADGIGVHPISISPPSPLSVRSGVSLLVARPLSAIVRIIAS